MSDSINSSSPSEILMDDIHNRPNPNRHILIRSDDLILDSKYRCLYIIWQFLILCKVCIGLFVILYYLPSQTELLREWVIVLISLDTIGVLLKIVDQCVFRRRPSIRYTRVVTRRLEVSIVLMYICWHVVGNALYWGCENCEETSPELTELAFVYLILGYLWTPLIVIPCCCACFCLPFLIHMLEGFVVHGNRQINQARIDKLKPVNYSGDADQECNICAEVIKLHDLVYILPCNPLHIFHVECSRQWFLLKPSCPTCRAELPI